MSDKEWGIRFMYGPSKNWILERTVGLYARTETGEPVMQGTGVLLKIADISVVLSAGHVLRGVKDMGLLIGPMVDDSHLIRPRELEVMAAEGHADIDVGFIRLFPATVDELSTHKKFARISDLAIASESPPTYYCFLGYPQKPNTPDYVHKRIDAQPLCYLTPSLVEGPEATPGVSFLVEITNNTAILSTRDSTAFEEQRIPHLKGISGCGIWRLDRDRDRPNSSPIRLIGIEYSWAPGKWIKGALIQHAISLLVDAYPDLRPCVSLTL